jgi:putative RecB family exonuclease
MVNPVETPEQLEFSGIPRPLFPATPSKLATFDCPRRYRMTYLDRPAPPKGPPWAHNTVGAATHLALARWWSADPRQRRPESSAALLRDSWHDDGFADADQSRDWREQAVRWITAYLHDEFDRHPAAAEPRGVERTVATRTPRLAISGRVDRIDEREGELVIVDYKTGRSRLTTDDVRGSQALALYALAAERTFRQRCRTVELHHLPSGSVLTWTHAEASLRQHIERAEHTATDIIAASDTVAGGADSGAVFEPKPGPGCSWCDFRRWCPEGQDASLERRSWDGLGILDADRQ